MPELNVDAEAGSKRDVRHLEESLQKLWEKARHVSETVIRLKEEKQELQRRVSSLESSEGRLDTEAKKQQGEISDLRARLVQLQSNGSSLFNAQEREEMKARLKELISKINSRL